MKLNCGRYLLLLSLILIFIAASNSAFSQEPTASMSLPSSDYSLTQLRKAVFSINWDASDDTLNNFKQEVRKSITIYKDDPLAVMYLQILDSFGEHIGTNRDKPNPKTIRIMQGSFRRLEEIIHENFSGAQPSLTPDYNPKILPGSLVPNESLAVHGTVEGSPDLPVKIAHVKYTPLQGGTTGSTENLNGLVKEIKAFIQSEISKLRNEIHALHQ